MQQMTGVRLFHEDKRLLSESEYLHLKENIDVGYRSEEDNQILDKEICEIYFDSSFPLEYQPEQFVIAVEKQGKHRRFSLKRRNKIGKYESEKAIKITKKEYRDILQGSVEWMKESKKILMNEFYCKLKLFQFKISKIMKCYREEIYIKCEKILLTIDREIKEYKGENSIPNALNQPSKVLVTVRCNQLYNNENRKEIALESYIQ